MILPFFHLCCKPQNFFKTVAKQKHSKIQFQQTLQNQTVSVSRMKSYRFLFFLWLYHLNSLLLCKVSISNCPKRTSRQQQPTKQSSLLLYFGLFTVLFLCFQQIFLNESFFKVLSMAVINANDVTSLFTYLTQQLVLIVVNYLKIFCYNQHFMKNCI